MISIIIFLLVLIILGTTLGIFKINNYTTEITVPPKYSGDKPSIQFEFNSKLVIKAISVILISIIVALVQPMEIQRIDAGNVGLKIDRVGNSKGIPVAQPCKGWVMYNSWATDVVEYSIRQNHVAYKSISVTTKGGFPLTTEPSFNYALKPDKAAALYINLLKGSDFTSLEDNFLMTATVLSLNNASNKYAIDSIFNDKQGYNNAVAQELNRELSAYFVVTQINPGTIAPPELKDVISAKTNAVQSAQQAELDKITAQAVAETKIATARGDSAQLVIGALAEAKAIQLKTREISDNYVQYIKWLNAGKDVPRVPNTVLGSGSGVLLSK